MIVIKLDGFSGRVGTLIDWEYTATGVVVRLHGPLAQAVSDGAGLAKLPTVTMARTQTEGAADPKVFT